MKPPSSWKTSRSPSCIIPLAFLVFIAVLYFEDFSCVLRPPLQRLHQLRSAGAVKGKKPYILPCRQEIPRWIFSLTRVRSRSRRRGR